MTAITECVRADVGRGRIERPEIEGAWVGTVDGEEVFIIWVLGD